MSLQSGFQGIAGLVSAFFPDLGVDSYQRSTCWDEQLKSSFIKSLVNDWPTGILVLNSITKGKGTPSEKTYYDVIDGQQRLSTLYEFITNPLIYAYEWTSKPLQNEPAILADLRDTFNTTSRSLRLKASNYVNVGTSLAATRTKLFEESKKAFEKKRIDPTAQIDQRLEPLVIKMLDLYRLVGQKSIAVHILIDTTTIDAEKMYIAINTQGKPVGWWELIRAGKGGLYNKIDYSNTSAYSVRYTSEIAHLSKLYYKKNKIQPRTGAQTTKLWDACYSLGEYINLLLSTNFNPNDPITNITELVPPDERKLKVDGLGFRLVSAFLCHDMGRVNINNLCDMYQPVTIARAVDCLFDTAKILFTPGGKYQLFSKYKSFGAGVIPSYPLVCLFIASAHMVAANSVINISDQNKLVLRILTEQIFRESICTDNWSGHGDTTLTEWLDAYFLSTSPDKVAAPGTTVNPATNLGGIKSIPGSLYVESEWMGFLSQGPLNQRSTTREWQQLLFFAQYLHDSSIPGTMPKGELEYDHIVACNPNIPDTTHPMNISPISKDLNSEKGGRSLKDWNPTGTNKSNYELQVMNGISVPDPRTGSSVLVNFLTNADINGLSTMIDDRKKVIMYTFKDVLRSWIANGD